MYYRSGTDGRCWCIYARQTFHFHSTVNTEHFPVRNNVMAAILNVWRHIRNPTPSNDAYIYGRNNPGTFVIVPVRFETTKGDLGYFEQVSPTTATRWVLMDPFLILQRWKSKTFCMYTYSWLNVDRTATDAVTCLPSLCTDQEVRVTKHEEIASFFCSDTQSTGTVKYTLYLSVVFHVSKVSK